MENSKGGEAAKYGIFFDDTEYDYTQHLRKVGVAKDAILIEAVKKGKEKGETSEQVVDSDEAVLNRLTYEDLDKLNLEPSVREVLEALEDERYEGELTEDFVGLLDEEQVDMEESFSVEDDEEIDVLSDYPVAKTEAMRPRYLNEELEKVLAMYEQDSDDDDDEKYDTPPLLVDACTDEKGLKVIDDIRRALADEHEKKNIIAKYALEQVEEQEEQEAKENIALKPKIIDNSKPKWDCESVQALLSKKAVNVPKTIGSSYSTAKKEPKIILKNGFPVISPTPAHDDSDSEAEAVNLGAPRNKNESAEEKRARKALIKAQKAVRRTEKKTTRATFVEETEKQKKILLNTRNQSKLIKIA